MPDNGWYLPLNGGTMVGDIGFSGAQTVDGVDISTHDHTGVAGHGVQVSHAALLSLVAPADDHTQYLLASGTRSLTGAWDAGSYQIRAETFQSDVATGTAPLVIASTTVVANLNSSLLEGHAAAYFAAAGGAPAAHAASHITGGGDIIASATAAAVGLCPVLSAVATQYLNGTGGWSVPAGTAVAHNFLSATHSDTTAAAAVVGSLICGQAGPIWAALAGDVAAVKKFLSATGTGAAANVPSWEVLAAADYPTMVGDAGAGGTKGAVPAPAAGDAAAAKYLMASGAWAVPAGTGGVTDHGALTGLSDDDHTQYLLAAGTRGLSAAWDAGSWQIRAETFQSDVATGTAPLTVASETEVAHFNAALLQGHAAAYFAVAGAAPAGHHASHEPAGGDAMAVDQAAATASLRTLGTGATAAAAGNHTHTAQLGWQINTTAAPAAVNNVAFTSLTAGTLYRLTWNVRLNTTDAYFYIRCNADSGNNYSWGAVADGNGGGGYLGAGAQSLMAVGSTASLQKQGFHHQGVIYFSTDPSDTTRETICGQGCGWNSTLNYFYGWSHQGYYDGAAAFSAFTFFCSAGTMTGTMILEKMVTA